MLPQRKIDEYLERKLDSFEWAKELTDLEIEEEMALLDPEPDFITKPRPLQYACFLISVYCEEFLFFSDMGFGKTKLMLDSFAYRKKCGQVRKGLALAKDLGNAITWEQEATLHRSDIKVKFLEGESPARWAELEKGDADFYILNYQGLVAMINYGVPKKKKKPTPKDRAERLAAQQKNINKLVLLFEFLTLDECTSVRNHTSDTHKFCYKIAASMKFRYGLTGTPIGRDPEKFWGQFKVIDRGATLGTTLGLFRGVFFTQSKGWFGGYEYKFKKALSEKLNRTLQHRSIYIPISMVTELPPQDWLVHRLELPESARKYYEMIKELGKKAKGDLKYMDKAVTSMRMLTSGYVRLTDPDTGQQIDVELPVNVKLDDLVFTLESSGPTEKFIIFHEYVKTGRMICDRLSVEKVDHVFIRGEQKDKRSALERFRDDPKCRILVGNNTSCSTALNLQMARYTYFFESPIAADVREQAERRTWRPGQEKSVFYIDPIVIGSFDEKVRKYNKEGKNLLKALVGGDEELA
tara:strand:+ start:862 stop:2430 length:1569 start_codon:yes stop_codon:yes gene_type:complete